MLFAALKIMFVFTVVSLIFFLSVCFTFCIVKGKKIRNIWFQKNNRRPVRFSSRPPGSNWTRIVYVYDRNSTIVESVFN